MLTNLFICFETTAPEHSKYLETRRNEFSPSKDKKIEGKKKKEKEKELETTKEF